MMMNSTKKIMAEKADEETPDKIHKIDMEDKKLKHFQYTHFRIPLYKHPGVNLFEIFVPLWILSFINLVVFFQ